MKIIYSVLGVLLLLFVFPSSAHAQLSTPDGDSIISIVALRVNGVAAHAALTEAGWYISRDGHAPDVVHKPGFRPYRLYPRKNHPDQFVQIWSGGSYKIMQVQNNAGILQAVEIWSDSIYIPGLSSAGIPQFYADEDMHATVSSWNGIYVLLAQRKLSSPNWVLDTLGLGRNSGYMVSDTANNFYLSFTTHVYVKMAGTNYYTLRPSAPYGSSILVDKNNRLYRPAGYLYKSDDAGVTWDSVASNFWVPSLIDQYGGMYGSGAGNTLRRSDDGGVTWSQIDSAIIVHSTDSLSPSNILDVAGDSVLYAATRWGVFVSADHGTHWQQNVASTGSVPKGYWKYEDGREVISTQLGIFVRNTGSSTWSKKFPSDPLVYNKIGAIQADTAGNLHTLLRRSDIYSFMPMISTDRGDSWSLDTVGLAALMTHTGLYDGINYFITEDGTALINADWTYKRTSGGLFLIDTIGLRANNFYLTVENYSGFATDYQGNYYMAIQNRPGSPARCIWHRPANSTLWAYDSLSGNASALFDQIRFNCFTSDHAGSVIGCADQQIYTRSGGSWSTIPVAVNEFCNAVTGDPSGAIFSTYYRDHNYGRHIYEGRGVYCTHDLGVTWSAVQGLDSVYVKAFQTIGDTTYVLGNTGLYKMTCRGSVVISGIPDMQGAGAFTLSPNPASAMCQVSIDPAVSSDARLSICDMTGRMIKDLAVADHAVSFSTAEMAVGIYVCTLQTGKGVVTQKKLVVSR